MSQRHVRSLDFASQRVVHDDFKEAKDFRTLEDESENTLLCYLSPGSPLKEHSLRIT